MSEANYQSSIRWELRGIDLILKEVHHFDLLGNLTQQNE